MTLESAQCLLHSDKLIVQLDGHRDPKFALFISTDPERQQLVVEFAGSLAMQRISISQAAQFHHSSTRF